MADTDSLIRTRGIHSTGLVNLFDVGIVLAVGFLVAGLSLSVSEHTGKAQSKTHTSAQTTLTTPSKQQTASGRGQAIGQVFRLPDGRLVLVGPGGGAPSP